MKRKLEIYQESIEDLTEAIQIDPSVASYFYQRGLSYKSFGQDEEARKNFFVSGKIGLSIDTVKLLDEIAANANTALKFNNRYSKLKFWEGITIKFINLIKKRLYRFKLISISENKTYK